MWRLILIIVIVTWRVVNIWKNWKLIKLSRQLKNDSYWLPFIGHAHLFFGTDEDHMKAFNYLGRQALKYNGITSSWLGDQLFVIVADPVLGECISKKLLEKGQLVMESVRPVIGNGSIFAPVNIWRPRRKILAPNFSPKQLNHFVKIFAAQSNIMIELLKSKVKAGPFSVWSYLTTYTMDAICESTLGIRVNAQQNHDHPLLKKIELGSRLVATRIVSPWQYNDTLYKLSAAYSSLQDVTDYLKKYIDGVIKSKRKEIEEKADETNNNETDIKRSTFKTFLELLITSSGRPKGFSDLELREETSVLLLAGIDTSAVGSAFVSVMLARHPDVQDKVYKELIEVFGDSKRPLTAEELPRLKYLDAVIRETLRLYPPGPVISRHCDQDFVLPSGMTLVKGCMIVVNIWAIHRNQEYWGDDAEKFRPERFLDTPFKHPAQFMPFSTGPRNCVGYQYAMMSMKTAIATLLRSYRLLPGTPTTPGGQHKPLRLKFDIMMKDVDNFIVQIEER